MPFKQTEQVVQRSPGEGTALARGAPDATYLRLQAQAMLREFGRDAAEVAQGRADDALDAGDGEGFQTWLDIAAAIDAACGRPQEARNNA